MGWGWVKVVCRTPQGRAGMGKGNNHSGWGRKSQPPTRPIAIPILHTSIRVPQPKISWFVYTPYGSTRNACHGCEKWELECRGKPFTEALDCKASWSFYPLVNLARNISQHFKAIWSNKFVNQIWGLLFTPIYAVGMISSI